MKSIRSRAPSASSALVRRIMQATPSQDTHPEMVFRSAIHREGLRFRKKRRPEPSLKCTADVVFPTQRICVFIDGCFWHGCPLHFNVPRINKSWWAEKIADNRKRDRRQTQLLQSLGWTVLRLWEHQVYDDLPATVRQICTLVADRTNNLEK